MRAVRAFFFALVALAACAGCGGRSGLELPTEAGGPLPPDAALADGPLRDLRRDTQLSPDAKGPAGTSWALVVASSSMGGEQVAVDGAGNAYISGFFNKTMVVGGTTLQAAGTWALAVAKLSPQGKVLWATAAQVSPYSYEQGLAASSSGEAWITGTFTGEAAFGTFTISSSGKSDVYVARLSPQGKFSWAVVAGGSLEDWGTGVAVDGAGNGYVTGFFRGTASFGLHTLQADYGSRIFVARLVPQGTFLWAVAAGASIGNDRGYDIAVDVAGYSAFTGYFHNKWIGGSLTLTGAFGSDIFVARLDPQGKFLWAAAATGEGSNDVGRHVALCSGGHTHISGSISGSVKLGPFTLSPEGYYGSFIARLDGKGSFEQAQLLKDEGTSDSLPSVGGLAADGVGNVHLAGTFSSKMTLGQTKLTSAGQRDVYVARIDPAGMIDWAISGGGKLLEGASDIAADNWGNRYVVGRFEDQATFGKTTLSGNGKSNLFIWRISSAGN